MSNSQELGRWEKEGGGMGDSCDGILYFDYGDHKNLYRWFIAKINNESLLKRLLVTSKK